LTCCFNLDKIILPKFFNLGDDWMNITIKDAVRGFCLSIISVTKQINSKDAIKEKLMLIQNVLQNYSLRFKKTTKTPKHIKE